MYMHMHMRMSVHGQLQTVSSISSSSHVSDAYSIDENSSCALIIASLHFRLVRLRLLVSLHLRLVLILPGRCGTCTCTCTHVHAHAHVHVHVHVVSGTCSAWSRVRLPSASYVRNIISSFCSAVPVTEKQAKSYKLKVTSYEVPCWNLELVACSL